jgi:hypothetical protein
MKKEKLILSFIATLFGLLVAGIAFYFFQIAKTPSNNVYKNRFHCFPHSDRLPSISLTVDQPKDEEVFDNNSINRIGKNSKQCRCNRYNRFFK